MNNLKQTLNTPLSWRYFAVPLILALIEWYFIVLDVYRAINIGNALALLEWTVIMLHLVGTILVAFRKAPGLFLLGGVLFFFIVFSTANRHSIPVSGCEFNTVTLFTACHCIICLICFFCIDIWVRRE